MKHLNYRTLSLAIFLFTSITLPGQQKEQPPIGGTPKDFKLPGKEVITLDNGLSLVMVPYGNIPKASIRIHVKTGNIDESENQIWLTDLLADLMEEGSTQRSSKQISDEVASLGGNLSIGVSAHSFNLSSAVLYEFAPEAIMLMADVLQHPAWPESELQRLKNDMKRTLAVQLSQPQVQAYKEFYANLYPNHPYGRPYPTDSLIDTYSVEGINSFYEEHFGALRTTVYVAGNFDKDQVRNAVEEAFGGGKKGGKASFTETQPVVQAGSRIIDRPGAPQSTIYYGLPVIDPTHPDFIALDVTNSLLGGSFGSRITSNIREDKGYTYSPNSVLAENYKSGLWYQVADVTTEHTGAALEEINREIENLQDNPPGAEELEGIQNYESGIFVLQNSTPNGIINQLVFLSTHNLDDEFLENRVKNIHAVTPEQIQEMTRKYIDTEKMLLIVVGDKKMIEGQIQESMQLPLRQ
jgi:predicted Zn-dependent peptidase